jgi:hypothetical protein
MNITVILNGYKRPHVLEQQIKSIENQSIQPKSIMLWQNHGADFDNNLTKNLAHSSCNQNLGVWARFTYALNANTEYICVFDDDTIPGKLWLENCVNTMKVQEGLLGTIGVKFDTTTSYWPATRVGWDKPNDYIEKVDIVGHSWFFKREWLSYFWRELPEINQSKLVGEDMHFSYTLQKYANIGTFVPPHPKNNIEMWGSIPEHAWNYGTDSNAISVNHSNMNLMSDVYREYIKKGFKTIKNG